MRGEQPAVDTPPGGMHDKSMTKRRNGASKNRPFMQIKHGSAIVPIYRGLVYGRTRYTVAFYLNQKRVRRSFASAELAKMEARTMAHKIQEGLSQTNDLRPQEREAYIAARGILGQAGPPLLAAVEEYMQCRKRLGEVPLFSVVEEFLSRTNGVKFGAMIPAVVAEFLKAKAEDQASKRYQEQLAHALHRFAKAFPGELRQLKSCDIDDWLRGLKVSPVTRNNTLRMVKVFFSFAKSRSYLPKSEATEAELISKVKEGNTLTEIFLPDQMRNLLQQAPSHLLPLYAIGAFAGLRAAELARLAWSAVDLDRRIIELRADQAKTASRRIIPVSENLAQWLSLVPRQGKVIPDGDYFRQATALARKAGVGWPHNVLRHSFISYRVALIQNANQVALEAGNSTSIIFKHYRELVTRDAAEAWFAIAPPPGWTPPAVKWNRQRRVFLERGGKNLG